MKQYIVDAFTEKVFSGNPAAVCIMEDWISDEIMMSIAAENNLSETAFAVKEGEKYHLRWFTPASEIDLCGHATLATAFVIMNYYEPCLQSITFETMSGNLTVSRSEDCFEMDFPAYHLNKIEVTDEVEQAIGVRPLEAYFDRDLLLVLDSQEDVKNLKPCQSKMKELEGLCIAVTAKGTDYDCVSRVFAPELNVIEDPVTGSTHCMIAPYWADKLNKNKITAFQASERTGILCCEVNSERVKLTGKAVLYSIAELFLDSAVSKEV